MRSTEMTQSMAMRDEACAGVSSARRGQPERRRGWLEKERATRKTQTHPGEEKLGGARLEERSRPFNLDGNAQGGGCDAGGGSAQPRSKGVGQGEEEEQG